MTRLCVRGDIRDCGSSNLMIAIGTRSGNAYLPFSINNWIWGSPKRRILCKRPCLRKLSIN